MKKTIVCLMLLAATAIMWAEGNDTETNTIPIYKEMEGNVTVHHEAAVLNLLENKILGTDRQVQTMSGFRVQVYSSNDVHAGQAEAFKVEKEVKESSLGVNVYTTFNAPFWKVRLGDCRTKTEAEQLRDEVRTLFPDLYSSTYIVRDQITLVK